MIPGEAFGWIKGVGSPYRLSSLGAPSTESGSRASPEGVPDRGRGQQPRMTEMVHDVRIIRIGDGPRLPAHVRPWFGDSWARWEDDALVVETTNLNPLQSLQGVPPSEHMKVTERFTPVDEETILYEFTVEDPSTYTQPWGGEIPIKKLNNRVYEYACHEGNYGMEGVLSGARYQERVEAEGTVR